MRKRLNNLNGGGGTSLVNGTPLTICCPPSVTCNKYWNITLIIMGYPG
ncbi:hypothetical protein HanXRQr2_Chr12g0559931 [Helianthus annuus]|uniref:Uncharacterized protein n=1 Tax=Helianthus annuus TaxID=4232 RepID=A0A9K3HJG3_HELAN|nr:hypothetical protein HanXRQr2_Chr12g0559931 [Helianthus annuus]